MNKDLRKSKRLEVKTGIANTPAGICQIINLSPEGLLFRCVKEWSFSRDWSLDIYDAADLSLEKLQVRKIWEEHLNNQGTPLQFSIIVGVAFKDLSDLQKEQLNAYIRKLESLSS